VRLSHRVGSPSGVLAVIAREAERSRFAVDTKPSGLFTLIGGHLEAVVSVVVAGDFKLEIRDKVPCRAARRACLPACVPASKGHFCSRSRCERARC
jgi:hypothetical protein